MSAHLLHRSRKFFNSACPCSVRVDSGWNCTPSTGCSRWRRPMISSTEPSSFSVHAVTSRQPGSESLSTTSERSEEHTSELQSLMRLSYAVFFLKKKNNKKQ